MKGVKKFSTWLLSAFAAIVLCLGMVFAMPYISYAGEAGATSATAEEITPIEAPTEPLETPTAHTAPTAHYAVRMLSARAAGVAQIGETQYESLQAAIDAVDDTNDEIETITLLQSVDLGATTLTINKSVILDLNKNTVTVSSGTNSEGKKINGYISIDKAGANITLKNGTVSSSASGFTAVYIKHAAVANIVDVNITKSGVSYGIYITSPESVLISGGTISVTSYGIYDFYGCNLKVGNVTIDKVGTGGICFTGTSSGKKTIEGCHISNTAYGIIINKSVNNTTKKVTKRAKCEVLINNCTIDKATTGIYDNGGIILEESDAVNNPDPVDETLDYVPGKTTVINSTINGCTSYGLSISKTGSIALDNVSITANTADTTIADPENTSHAGIAIFWARKLTVQDCTIESDIPGQIGITGNGSHHGTDIEVINTAINATMGIYHPQDGVLTVSGGEINADEIGIEIRSGSLTISNNTVISVPQDVELSVGSNTSGGTVSGAALAISQHTTNKPINVTVESATLSAKMALVQVDPENIADTRSPVSISVKGGKFTGGVQVDESRQSHDGAVVGNDNDHIIHFISGGEFDTPPKALYLAENAVAYPEDNGEYIVLTDVEQAKRDASAFLRLYAAAKDVAYTAEIDAIVNNDGIITLAGVYDAKIAAMDKIDELADEIDALAANLAQAKKDAIAEILQAAAEKPATDTTEKVEAVAVPTAAIAAINAAVDADQVKAFKDNALAEIESMRQFRKLISDTQTALNTKLDALKTDVGTLTGRLNEVNSGLLEDIAEVYEKVSGLGNVATDALAASVADVREAVDSIAAKVSAAVGIEEEKEKAAVRINHVLDNLFGEIEVDGDRADSKGSNATLSSSLTAEQREKLRKIYTEETADLVELYYKEAVTSLENATTVEEVQSTADHFQRNVDTAKLLDEMKNDNASNKTSLTGVYVLLACALAFILILLIVLIVTRKSNKKEQLATADDGSAAATATADDGSAAADSSISQDVAAVDSSAAVQTSLVAAPIFEAADEAEEPDEAEADEDDDDDDEDDDDGDNASASAASNAFAHAPTVHKTFEMRLKEIPDQVLEDYSMIKNELCNYVHCKSRVSKNYESFHVGHTLYAKIKMLGKSMRLYLALDPDAYSVKKYHHADKRDTKAYAAVPMMVKVSGSRSLQHAVELIGDCMKGVKKNAEFVWVDYAEQIRQQTAKEGQASED